MLAVNLSRKPFLNLRPVQRAAAILWVATGLLLVLNVWLYWSHSSGFEDTGGRLADVRAAIGEETEHRDQLEETLARLDLEEQNAIVAFHNRLILQRTFPWSALFDRLASVLPEDVRLTTVRPAVRLAEEGPERRRRRPSSSRRAREGDRTELGDVALRLTGYAKSGDELLDFVDRLYADTAFLRPILAQESRDRGNETRFALTVDYRTTGDRSRGDEAEGGERVAVVEAADPTPAGDDEDDGGAVAEAAARGPRPPPREVVAPSGSVATSPPPPPAGRRAAGGSTADPGRGAVAVAPPRPQAGRRTPPLAGREEASDEATGPSSSGLVPLVWLPDQEAPVQVPPGSVDLAMPGAVAESDAAEAVDDEASPTEVRRRIVGGPAEPEDASPSPGLSFNEGEASATPVLDLGGGR